MKLKIALALFSLLLIAASAKSPPGPVKHYIVLMMENRAFDHLLGYAHSEIKGITGLTGLEFNHWNVSEPQSPKIHVSQHATDVCIENINTISIHPLFCICTVCLIWASSNSTFVIGLKPDHSQSSSYYPSYHYPNLRKWHKWIICPYEWFRRSWSLDRAYYRLFLKKSSNKLQCDQGMYMMLLLSLNN